MGKLNTKEKGLLPHYTHFNKSVQFGCTQGANAFANLHALRWARPKVAPNAWMHGEVSWPRALKTSWAASVRAQIWVLLVLVRNRVKVSKRFHCLVKASQGFNGAGTSTTVIQKKVVWNAWFLCCSILRKGPRTLAPWQGEWVALHDGLTEDRHGMCPPKESVESKALGKSKEIPLKHQGGGSFSAIERVSQFCPPIHLVVHPIKNPIGIDWKLKSNFSWWDFPTICKSASLLAQSSFSSLTKPIVDAWSPPSCFTCHIQQHTVWDRDRVSHPSQSPQTSEAGTP